MLNTFHFSTFPNLSKSSKKGFENRSVDTTIKILNESWGFFAYNVLGEKFISSEAFAESR